MASGFIALLTDTVIQVYIENTILKAFVLCGNAITLLNAAKR